MDLAIVHGDAIEVYHLPPLTTKEEAELKLAQASAPPENDLPRPTSPQRKPRPPLPRPTQTLPSGPGHSSLQPHLPPPPALRLTPIETAGPPTSPPSQTSRLQSLPRQRPPPNPPATPHPASTAPHPPYTPSPTTNHAACPERHAPIETVQPLSRMGLYTPRHDPRSFKISILPPLILRFAPLHRLPRRNK